MRQECQRATETALGRPITQAEARDLEGRVRRAMVQEARKDPAAWRALSLAQRVTEGGRAAAAEIVAEAQKAAQRAALNVQKMAELEQYLDNQVIAGRDKNTLEALERTLAAKYDEGGQRLSLEAIANGLENDAIRRVSEAAEAVTPGVWGRIAQVITQDRSLQIEFINALHGAPGARPEIQKAADTFHKVAGDLRQHFNDIGGKIGRLDNWGMPHAWSRRKALKLGKESFVEEFMGFVDRSVYVHDDGRAFSDAEMQAFLEEAWLTIASDGVSKERERTPGGATKANRHAKHRQIHLHPEAAVEALMRYSDNNPLQAMFGHLRQMTRDIALLETFGANPDHVFQTLVQKQIYELGRAEPENVGKHEGKADSLQRLYDHLAGNVVLPKSRLLADTMAVFRAQQTAAKLGGVVISSFTDLATLHATALHNNLNPVKVALNSALVWSPKSRKYVRRLGLMTDVVIGHGQRYAADHLTGRGVATKTASFVLAASGLNFVTDARRLGFTVTLMDALGAMTRRAKSIGALSAQDRALLQRKGIGQADWDIWSKAKLERHGLNGKLLTPEAIMAVEGYDDRTKRLSVARLLGLLEEERDIAVITPGARERVQMTLGTDPGTIKGELVRSIFLFKSFPWTVTQRYWERSRAYGGMRAAYVAAMMLSMTMLGAVVLWLKDLLAGRDPRSLAFWSAPPWEEQGHIPARNVVAAAMQGGGLGIFGDFLFNETHSYSQNTLLETAVGPVPATIGQFANLTQGNIAQALAGEETDVGPESVRFARSNVPGANLWYLKSITDRLVWNQLAEELQPGYFDRLQDRQRRTQGYEYWWQLDETAPERAPQVAAGLGQ